MSADFAGRPVAFVTGASRGIGRAVTVMLASRGFAIFAAGRDAVALEVTAAELQALGAPSRLLAADLSSEAGINSLGDAVERLPRLDVLVHAAGVFSAGVDSASAENFARSFAVNCTAAAMITRRACPALIEAKGLVVFISSTQALRPSPGVGVYAASKAALGAFAESLRGEIGSAGVRVTTLVPGSTATAMQETVSAVMNRPVDMASIMQPEDVAAMVGVCVDLPANVEVPEIVMRPMPYPSTPRAS
jgi:short-subunit dehydrogenase